MTVITIQSRNLIPVEELEEFELPARIAWVRAPVLSMSQSQFAAAVGVAVRTVKGWEHPDLPRGAPKVEQAERIAELVGQAYPARLFTVPAPPDPLAEINRKLDLIMEHLGIGVER